MSIKRFGEYDSIVKSEGPERFKQDIIKHITSTLGQDPALAKDYYFYKAAAYAVRDRLIDRWIRTQRAYYDEEAKRIYYLSLEFLPGRFLKHNLINTGLAETCRLALEDLGYSLEEIEELEWDAGLGNGGLGRLASCFMDSLATLKIPAYGYGIRYDYGIFYQVIENGYQVEKCDNWLRHGNCWEFERPEHLYEVRLYGSVNEYADHNGNLHQRWENTENIMAMACDTLIPGYKNDHVINMRLWAARSSRDFNLELFNVGKYISAVEDKVSSENISKVLYPSEETPEGKELRLKQQYFFVSATFQDIIRRFKKRNTDFNRLPDRVVVQLNDTHPVIAIPELMRILLDEEGVPWEAAWEVCVKIFGYTNHTIMPEALETWPVSMMQKVLPRHMQIIYAINQRFLDQVIEVYPGDTDRLSRMSLIQEQPEKRVRMAHLGIVGSHSTNGVSALHTRILKEKIFSDFFNFFPQRFNSKTNGITPRRWLLSANPGLSELISSAIGDRWIRDLTCLEEIASKADEPEFRMEWLRVRKENKQALAKYIKRKVGIEVDPQSLFDVQAKRIHEYKRQILNLLHAVTLYIRLKKDPAAVKVPRTVIFGGKAAPGYFIAKLIIKLINSVSEVVNQDPAVNDLLKVLFLPNYCVSQAEKLIAATDLSEQISTAGMEASGTGNMKFALNGAVIIGTPDGANVEIMEEVGPDNIFIFGLTVDEVKVRLAQGYSSRKFYEDDAELKAVVDLIASGFFSPEHPLLFKPILDRLFRDNDPFMILADYRSFVDCQERVTQAYLNQETWVRRSILNTAHMGKFSSDRSILEYAEEIWNVSPIKNSGL